MIYRWIGESGLGAVIGFILLLSGETMWAQRTSLKLEHATISDARGNTIRFRSVGSNSVTYRARLICFNQPNYQEGSFIVLKSRSHVGASALFPYQDCLEARRLMLAGKVTIELSWDQKAFEDFISTKLRFEIKKLRD